MSAEEDSGPESASTAVHDALRDPKLQIRLLYLDAGSDEDGISGSLEVWDKEVAPPYRAISYVCGDPEESRAVLVNGNRLPVRHNCHYALWQTRLHFPDSRVWIDAICINQLDLEEKTAQVTMMSEIYTNADQVLACIGPSDTHSDVVIRAMNDVDAFVQDFFGTGWWKTPMNLNLWDPPLDEVSAAQLLSHYNEFSMRPYFTRVWVLQELAAGRDHALLLCGRGISDWDDVTILAYRLSLMYIHGSEGPYEGCCHSRIHDIDHTTLMQYHDEYQFPRYLKKINRLQCQDVRDRIYSTSALVDWVSFDQTPPVPDYQISPVELALQLVEKMVDTRLHSVESIVQALDLSDPSRIPQVLEELQARRLDTKTHKAIHGSYRQWYTRLSNVQMVQQGIAGRPLVYFDHVVPKEPESSTASSQHAKPADFSSLSRETLTACKLSPIYKGEVLAAVVSEHTQAGDIIIRSRCFDLVLRPHGDGEKLVVIGDAFMASGFELANKARFTDDCDCYISWPPDGYEMEFVQIATELSNEEALAVVISRIAMINGGCDFPEYLKNSTMGRVKVGSLVWDVTAEKMNYEHSVGPVRPACAVHKAGDYHWKHQKFFWYSVLAGTGTRLPFTNEDRP